MAEIKTERKPNPQSPEGQGSPSSIFPERAFPAPAPSAIFNWDGSLREECQRVQQQHALPEPEAVRLSRPEKGREDEVLPQAVMAEPTPAPRFIHQNERAPAGLKRYKIRCTNYGCEQPYRYVLAASRARAEAYYGQATGLVALVQALGDDAREPLLSVVELPD